MAKISLFRKSIVVAGSVAIVWQTVFVVLYLTNVLPRLGSSVADGMMNGAAVCGVIGALTCYFPYFLKDQVGWMERREGSSVAISFILLFFSLGIILLVFSANWIGSM